ncbi:MAG: ATP-binding cassette domain-containing protein [Proteobacteria bacterium]|nr:ATP-binding cassette domain-containing protein [Pseudomonadota bacterium]
MNTYGASSSVIIRLDRVALSYATGHHVFYDLNYSFFTNGFYFLTGPSGIGKTSLLKLIYGDIKASEGSVTVFGKDVSLLSEKERASFFQKMGLVFQDCRLLDHLTVLDNVALPMKIGGTDLKKSRVYAKELLHWVGVGDHIQKYPSLLSDGQRQRVAIARAIITRPLLLLADEPTGNVDDMTAYKMINLFEELNKMGTTVIVATHNRQIVSSFPYPELQLYQGQLIMTKGAPYPYNTESVG